jgi:hypothetical protein
MLRYMKNLLISLFLAFPLLLHAQSLQLIKEGDLYGLKNSAGRMIVPPLYDTLEHIFNQYGDMQYDTVHSIIQVMKDGRYGAYNLNGKMIISPEGSTFLGFEMKGAFLMALQQDYIRSLYDLEGNLLPGPGYTLRHYWNSPGENDGFIFLKNGKNYLYDEDMKQVGIVDSISIYLPLGDLRSAIITDRFPLVRKYPAMKQKGLYRYITWDGKKYGFADHTNREIFSPGFDDVEPMNVDKDNGTSPVVYFIFRSDSLSIVVDTLGKILFSGSQYINSFHPEAGCVIVMIKQEESEYGQMILKLDGNALVTDTFKNVSRSPVGPHFIGADSNFHSTSLIDFSGRQLLPPGYRIESTENIFSWYELRCTAIPGLEEMVGYANDSGRIVVPCYYESVVFQNDWTIKVTTNDEVYNNYLGGKEKLRSEHLIGLMDWSGNLLFLTDRYEDFGPYSEGLSIAALNPAYLYYEQKADEGPFEHSEITEEELNKLPQEKKFFYIDKKGKRFGKATFDFCGQFTNGTAVIIVKNTDSTGTPSITIDLVDTNSLWFIHPEKALLQKRNNMDITIFDFQLNYKAKGDNFILYDFKDSCILLKRDGAALKPLGFDSCEMIPFECPRYGRIYWDFPYSVYLIQPGKMSRQQKREQKKMLKLQKASPTGFALSRNGKYALFDSRARQCSDFVIDSIQANDCITPMIFIGKGSGLLNNDFTVKDWKGSRPPKFRLNDPGKINNMIITPEPARFDYEYGQPLYPPHLYQRY